MFAISHLHGMGMAVRDFLTFGTRQGISITTLHIDGQGRFAPLDRNNPQRLGSGSSNFQTPDLVSWGLGASKKQWLTTCNALQLFSPVCQRLPADSLDFRTCLTSLHHYVAALRQIDPDTGRSHIIQIYQGAVRSYVVAWKYRGRTKRDKMFRSG